MNQNIVATIGGPPPPSARATIAVLGAGAWGTALAALLGRAGHDVALWDFDPVAAARLASCRENPRWLPGCRLPDSVRVTSQLGDAVAGSELVLAALPSHALRARLVELAPMMAAEAVVVCASKGLEPGTSATMDRVLETSLPGRRVALLSGPSFADEVAAGLPTAVVAAARDPSAAMAAQRWLAGERFRVYTSDDPVGVAVGGALKNVIAIAAGCSDALGFGHNARAALITRGLHEIARLAVRLGGNPMTLSGLAGMGDLVLTCTGELSRNRRVGLALGRGEQLPAIMAALGHVAEGVTTAQVARELSGELQIEMPITAEVAAILHDGKNVRAAVASLLSRDFKPELG